MILETLLAFDPTVLAAFITAGVILNLTPGADVMFVTASSMAGGTKSGVAAGLGISLGALAHVSLAAIGVAALIAANPSAFTALKWTGILYLLYLAVQAWRASADLNAQTGKAELFKATRKGFLTNLLNPKVSLFILAFLPQFTDPAIGPIWVQILILGAIFIFNGTLITMAYALLAGQLAGHMRKILGPLNKLSSVVFGGLAVRLALE